MWAEACAMIERAEQLHRQFFYPGAGALPQASWEPPIDVFENESELLLVVALPGVESNDIQISSEPGGLVVTGARRLPAAARGTEIRRLEIPHGRFERRIALPPQRWQLTQSTLVNGCLLLNLTKQA
jgi:HSP20 family protein